MQTREILWRAGRTFLPTSATAVDGDLLTGCDSSQDWEHALERFRLGVDRPSLLDQVGAQLVAGQSTEHVSNVVKAAQAASEQTFQFFGYPPTTISGTLNWNWDPIAGVQWPSLPSERINHRIAAGDVKWIWELNRLQHLPWLAQAWLFTGNERYSNSAFEQLDSWIIQNPPGQGIAWRGAFEAGIRAISVAVALQGLRDSPHLTVERYREIVNLMAHTAQKCWRERSRFSSANNHLVGEMAGLAVIAIMMPELKGSADWEQLAVEALCCEASKQILPDGSGAEQAIGYQMFTGELLHLVAALLVVRDDRAPQRIVNALSRSSAFLAAAVGFDDPDPRYGDDDEGFAVRLGPAVARTIRHHLGILAAFEWGAAGAYAATNSVDAEWFRAISPSHSVPSSLEDSTTRATSSTAQHFAKDGGLVILRSEKRRITMDVGPLGYLSIAAHGHADALSITLSDAGHDIIGDPGTGSYYGHPTWREVMRGTRAHSTVTVDDSDQSTSGGPFLWSRHAKTSIRRVDLSEGFVDAEHDGYRRLHGDVVHRRWLIAPPNERASLVIDQLTGRGAHQIRTTWPLHPSLDITYVEGGHLLHRSGSPIFLLLQSATTTLICDDVRGDESRNLGWWSERLETRVPSWWLCTNSKVELPLAVATLISPTDGIHTSRLRLNWQGQEIRANWLEDERERAITLFLDSSTVVFHDSDELRR
ncbi:heparinase II/III family protein [Mycolicibacterium hippocampi]|nr:alginate lyase family protein [Mycolicibacterium hippocampi]